MKYFTKDQVDLMIPEGLISDFTKFIRGSACPIVDDQMCFYKHDVVRFLKKHDLAELEGTELC